MQRCVGVKLAADSSSVPTRPPDQLGSAHGDFRFSCAGYSVYRVTGKATNRDESVELPFCEGLEVRGSLVALLSPAIFHALSVPHLLSLCPFVLPTRCFPAALWALVFLLSVLLLP